MNSIRTFTWRRHHDPKQERLARHPLFRHLARRQIRELARVFDEAEVPAGAVLARAGDLPHTIAIVVSGSVGPPVPAGEHIASAPVLGLREAIEHGRHHATVLALTPVTLLVTTTRELHRLLAAAPGLAVTVPAPTHWIRGAFAAAA